MAYPLDFDVLMTAQAQQEAAYEAVRHIFGTGNPNIVQSMLTSLGTDAHAFEDLLEIDMNGELLDDVRYAAAYFQGYCVALRARELADVYDESVELEEINAGD